MASTRSVRELAAAINQVEATIRRNVPEAPMMYLEPDVTGTDLPSDPFAPVRRTEPAD